MQRIHIGRIGGVLLAAGAVMAVGNADAISLLAMEASQPAPASAPGVNDIQLDPVALGLGTILAGHRVTWFPAMSVSAGAPRLPMHCAFDAHFEQRVCQSQGGSDSTRMVRAVTYRGANGALQQAFDDTQTDTVTAVAAFVNSAPQLGGRSMTSALRSTQQFAGTSNRSATRVLNGADTVITIDRWSGTARRESQKVVTYSQVTMGNDAAARFPTSGLVMVSTSATHHNTRGTSGHHATTIVYFDGTSTPEAHINGIRYRLNLETGIATPFNGA